MKIQNKLRMDELQQAELVDPELLETQVISPHD
jgi:hypothetical protein